MSIESMTGIGQSESNTFNYVIKIEIKSVNNRFKDYKFRIPHHYSSLEFDLKKLIDKNFSRGSFDVYLNIKKSSEETSFVIDYNLVNLFLENFQSKVNFSKNYLIHIDPTHYLRTEFQKNDEENSLQIKEMTLKTFESALLMLKKSRVEEGKKLKKYITDHLSSFENEYTVIKKNADAFKEEVSKKLKTKFQFYLDNSSLDQGRFHQEIIYHLERMDIEEEINRISYHLTKISELISAGGEVGRKIDFLVQELNREVNTIGSKSHSETITNCVVNMKVQLEKIREQALNLE